LTGRPLSDLTFDEWVIFVFDHPVDQSRLEWYWDLEADRWDAPAARTVEYLTRAFENALSVFEPYSDSQLNQGLWYLASNACSEHMFALMDVSVPWPDRKRCIRSFYTLYEQCFAKRCTPHLSHLDEPGAGPLNSVCYMWWDILPVVGQPADPSRVEMDREILQVMESALKLDSIACQESALHGLGHWQLYYSKPVKEIIQAFLQRNKTLPEKLQKYALNAASGCVL
jgi:hypothetical protein